jgi:hypothetical protein
MKVAYQLSACQIGTNTKLTAMTVGQSFDLVLTVQDLRPSGTWTDDHGVKKPLVRGVFAAYCDVLYDKHLAKLTQADASHPEWFLGCFTFKNGYVNGQRASDAADRINGAGAFTSAFGGNQSPVEVWRVRMTCRAPGSLVFKPDVSELSRPACDTLVYGNDNATPPEASYVGPGEVVLIPCAVTVSQ